jgi:hypothetical protein
MTFDEFIAEAERLNLTVNDLVPGVLKKLDEMEKEGVIRKHEDGGHEYVNKEET